MQHQDKALLLAILETAIDAIIVIDDEGIIQSVNPATSSLFGYDKGELIGQNVKMLMPSPYFEEHDDYLLRYKQTGQPKIIGIGREVTGRRKDGSTFPIHLAVSRVMRGDQMMFAGIIRDISDLKQAQKQLAIANEELERRVKARTEELHAAQAELLKSERLATLGQVSGGIAHEIRNPLNAVRTSAYYLLNAQQPSAEKVAEHLQRIDRQVSLIDNVVTALTDMARLPDPALRACDVAELLHSVVPTVSVPHNVNVEIHPYDGSLVTTSDPNQLSIVFRNLIRNARDAMPTGGSIIITARVEGEALIVDVADTGIGIAPENLKRITEPLFTTKARGMGLGLAISAAILHNNRGRLEVQSKLNQGATFSVHLPLATERSGA
jgi:two-component system sensor kinase FixL